MLSPSRIYSAFGLTIASDIELPELPVADAAPDVFVRVSQLGEPLAPEGWRIDATPSEAHGWAPAAGGFAVRQGSEILVEPAPDADERAIRMAIVGPLLGVILSQRGRFVLHASTVVVDGRAVAFAGPSGRGKSTVTAAMTSAGHDIIADDMTVIDFPGDVPVVQPAFPRVKLWPDSAEAFAEDADALPLIHPERTKRSLEFRDNFHAAPVPLARCYLLEDGDSESTSELRATDAVLALVRSTYQASWMHQTGGAGPNLLHCAELVRSDTVRVLRRRRSFAALPDVVAFIERDAASAP